ncbi:MAG TPA: hypothetical protein VH640_04585 [Bryobacteraceae bacterium]|jgi:hypothetical protein
MLKHFVLWLYWIPTWQLAILIFVAIGSGSLAGLLICRRLVLRRPHKGNDLVFNFVASAGVVYALVLGLIAVATWEKFKEVEGIVNEEAFAVNDLYIDVGGLDEQTSTVMRQQIRDYLNFVIEKEWPAQKVGTAIEGGDALARQLATNLVHAEAVSNRQSIIQAQALVELNNFLNKRRARRHAVDDALPGVLYLLVLVGAGVLIMMTYVLWTEEFGLQFLLTLALAAMISLVVLLIVAMDHPLWGQVSVSADAYRNVLQAISR